MDWKQFLLYFAIVWLMLATIYCLLAVCINSCDRLQLEHEKRQRRKELFKYKQLLKNDESLDLC